MSLCSISDGSNDGGTSSVEESDNVQSKKGSGKACKWGTSTAKVR